MITYNDQEIAIIKHLALPDEEVARRVGLAKKTVSKYSQVIFGKLGARNRTSALLKAIHDGIIKLEDVVIE